MASSTGTFWHDTWALCYQNPPPFSATARLLPVLRTRVSDPFKLLRVVHALPLLMVTVSHPPHRVSHSSFRNYLRCHLHCKENPDHPSPKLDRLFSKISQHYSLFLQVNVSPGMVVIYLSMLFRLSTFSPTRSRAFPLQRLSSSVPHSQGPTQYPPHSRH